MAALALPPQHQQAGIEIEMKAGQILARQKFELVIVPSRPEALKRSRKEISTRIRTPMTVLLPIVEESGTEIRADRRRFRSAKRRPRH